MKSAVRSILILLLLAVLTLPHSAAQIVRLPAAHALTGFDTGGSCPVSQRFHKWGDFVVHGLSYVDWWENWVDIFARNACQRDDIMSLQDQLEKLRQQIREKIYTCNDEGLDDLTAAEGRLQMELMYVRLVVDSDTERATGEPHDILKRNRVRIYRELYEDFVDSRKLFGESYFNEIFLQLESKYRERLQDYLVCSDPTWEELSQKWNTFVDHAAGITPAWDRLEQGALTQWKRVKDAPAERTGNFLGGFLDIKLNGLQPKQSLQDIIQKFQENAPGGAASYLDVLAQADAERFRYRFEEDAVKRLARYEALYRHGSDDATRSFVERMALLNTVLKESFPLLENLHQCVADVAAKQCAQ